VIAPPPEVASQNDTVTTTGDGDEPQRDAIRNDDSTIGIGDDVPVVPPKANDDTAGGEENLIYALDAPASPLAAAAILGAIAAITAAVLAAAAVVSHRKSMEQ
jgi:hypothetical protein